MEDESAQGLVTEVFDEQGRLLGAFVAKSLWERLKKDAAKAAAELASAQDSASAEGVAEPIKDWETLVACWDFQYPVDYSVHCGVCGTALTVRAYLDAEHACPVCDAAFNPGCATHYDRYFEGC